MICKYLLFITLVFENANINVELDVAFIDSTVNCLYLYVVCFDKNDTIAAFDTLSFNKHDRVSLFYSVKSAGKNRLSIIDSTGIYIESKPFMVSPRRTVFSVVVEQQLISVAKKDYLYLKKNENENSYFIFLLFFFLVKVLITTVFVFISNLPRRNITISSGAFLLSSFIDWHFPVYYLYRLLLTMLVEYLLIAIVGRNSISWLQALLLVKIVNVSGFGIIAILYLSYIFV